MRGVLALHTAPEAVWKSQFGRKSQHWSCRGNSGTIGAVRDYWDGERVTRAFLLAREADNY